MVEEEVSKPINIYRYFIPLLRLTVILLTSINLVNQVIDNGLQINSVYEIMGTFITTTFNVSFLLFYTVEFSREIKGTFVQAIYLRIVVILMELATVILIFYLDSIFLFSIEIQSENWFYIVEMNFLAMCIFMLSIVNLKRTWSILF